MCGILKLARLARLTYGLKPPPARDDQARDAPLNATPRTLWPGDRGHEHSVLHIQQLQAASDGAARVPRWSIRLRNYGATIVCVM